MLIKPFLKQALLYIPTTAACVLIVCGGIGVRRSRCAEYGDNRKKLGDAIIALAFIMNFFLLRWVFN